MPAWGRWIGIGLPGLSLPSRLAALCQAALCSVAPCHPLSHTGYVAIGFSDRPGRMGPADAYAGWVDASGVAHVVDFATTGHSISTPDLQQDASGVSGTKANGRLSITFTRKLDTAVCPTYWLGSNVRAPILPLCLLSSGSNVHGHALPLAATCRMPLIGSSGMPT